MTTATANIKQNTQPLLEYLKQIHWRTTIEYLVDVEQIESTQVTIAVQQCKALLILAFHYSHLSLVPTYAMDSVIHTYMANSSQTHPNHFKFAGLSFYHSHGLGTRGEGDRRRWLATFKRTQRLFKQHFGAGMMDHSPPACCEILLLDSRKL
jgi:hypothetical protein